MAKCDNCGSTNIRRTQPGAVFDDYSCQSCCHTFTRVAPATKRMAIFGGIALLTGGLDFGILGGLASSLIDSDDQS